MAGDNCQKKKKLQTKEARKGKIGISKPYGRGNGTYPKFTEVDGGERRGAAAATPSMNGTGQQ